jgi:hypothetical protein
VKLEKIIINFALKFEKENYFEMEIVILAQYVD